MRVERLERCALDFAEAERRTRRRDDPVLGGAQPAAGAAAPPPAPSPGPPPSCALELDPASGDAAAAGSDGQIRVRPPDAGPGTAVSKSGWIAITAGAAGKGNGEVRYRVAPNTDQHARSASVTIVDRSFIVRQAAALPPPPPPTPASCSFEIDPESKKFDAEGGGDRVRVRATDGCAWTASTQNGWITITGGAAGKGNGEVRYQVAANPGAARDGAVTVAERTLSIKQEGAPLRKMEIKGEIR